MVWATGYVYVYLVMYEMVNERKLRNVLKKRT